MLGPDDLDDDATSDPDVDASTQVAEGHVSHEPRVCRQISLDLQDGQLGASLGQVLQFVSCRRKSLLSRIVKSSLSCGNAMVVYVGWKQQKCEEQKYKNDQSQLNTQPSARVVRRRLRRQRSNKDKRA